MKQEEIERLRFRNQYILAPKSVKCPFLNEEYIVNDTYRLYSHVDLHITIAEVNGTKIWLLGDLFDFESPQKSNFEILIDLLVLDYDGILHKLGKYTGRFVLIYKSREDLKLVHDATAARKIYYSLGNGDAWFSSQSYLLAKVLQMKKTHHPEILDYYNSQEFILKNNANIGDTTIYDGIRQLMPNHYFDVKTSSRYRYWPSCRIDDQRPLKEVASNCAHMVKGFMEGIMHRYEVMLPVTAGKDSRTLMAATKSNPERVYYYINKENHVDDNFIDITIPKKLLGNLDLKFHVLDPYIEVDDDFRRVYFENNEFGSEKYLPLIYNYYLNFNNKVNLPGNTATAGSEWFMGRKITVTGENLAKKNRVGKWSFAIDYYDQWIKEIGVFCPENNINLIDLFYWEERIANWGNQIQLDKDISQEDINVFNSRDLVMQYLSVHPKYLEIPTFKVYVKVIDKLWPELLNVPINKGFKKTLIKVLKTGGVLNLYLKFKYA
ncbi:MAG: hypothetical protein R6W31_08160 [Bacteroidales bacterium]